MNRRHFLQAGAATALSLGLWPGRLRAAENGQGESGWTFIAVNDLHYEDVQCGPWFEKVVAAMKAGAPSAEFCILGGDQANRAQPEQFAAVRDIFKTLGIPLYPTVGNHDWTDDGSRKSYDEIFPGQLNTAFEHRDWQVIGLDTSDGPAYHDTSIQPSTLTWLDDNLPKLSRSKPTILYTHFPLGDAVKYRPKNADALLDRFKEFNLQGAFSGHFHGLTEKPWNKTILTTDRCCSRFRNNHDGTKQKGWFVCRSEEGKIRREFVEIPAELRA
jgi:predicted MPP superfamily phosphohydrolase